MRGLTSWLVMGCRRSLLQLPARYPPQSRPTHRFWKVCDGYATAIQPPPAVSSVPKPTPPGTTGPGMADRVQPLGGQTGPGQTTATGQVFKVNQVPVGKFHESGDGGEYGSGGDVSGLGPMERRLDGDD